MTDRPASARRAAPIRPGSARWLGYSLLGLYGKREGDAPFPLWFRVLDRFGIPAALASIAGAAGLLVARWLGGLCP